MSRMDYLQQGGTPFDGFLYATLGEDSRGYAVSVLSALARLQLEGAATDVDVVLGLDTSLTAMAAGSGLFAPHGQPAAAALPVAAAPSSDTPLPCAAAPAPLTTIFISPIFLPAISNAFNKAALEIIAVPCWSS